MKPLKTVLAWFLVGYLSSAFAAPQTPSSGGKSSNWLGAVLAGGPSGPDDTSTYHPPRVTRVLPGSPAAKAGIQKADQILGLQGEPISSVEQAEAAIEGIPVGGELHIELLRSGEGLQLTVSRGGTKKVESPSPKAATASDRPAGARPSPAPAAPTPEVGSGIFVNGRELKPKQIKELKAIYGFVAPKGRYWYDARSGLWGLMGFEAAGLMRPGHDFGPMPANPSNGHAGVFINGREINLIEAAYCQRVFGGVYQGRWWLDGRTGNIGLEGNPMPIANVFVALQRAQNSKSGGYSWSSSATGAYGGSSGGCSYVSIPGSGTVSSGCD